MSFDLTEEQILIRDMARDFAQRELAPKAAERDRTGEFPRPELVKLGELGLLGVNVPERYGGSEAGVVSYSLAITELAKACAATTVAVAVTNMVAEVVTKFGTDVQRERYVPGLVDGSAVAGAFALSEPRCGSDAGALTTRARPTDDGWVLDGNKQWITSGDHAGLFVVWARSNEEPGAKGLSAFLVEKDTPGIIVGRHEDKMGLRGSSTVPLTFEECRIPREALLDRDGGGFRIAMVALDGGRIGVASQALGIGLAALDEAIAYAKERKTFGRPIAKHQAIQGMLAEMALELEAARLLILRAASLKEKGVRYTREASMGKLYATEAANRACYASLQIHGGYGYTKDYTIERLTRDARVTAIYEGTSEIQRLVIGRMLLAG
ncbi:MAG: acyl-CoA dehydrogenase family protein [Deltaproteobacteria bacterium]|nr:acyl-CoA dehydrogenase family protein [Deltaproteobacteria bacterium]